MVVYHLNEIFYRFIYILISISLSALAVWQMKEIWLFNICQLTLITVQLSEAFFSYLNLALYTAFIINFPFICYQIVSFITPGLFIYEFKNFKFFSLLGNTIFFSVVFLYFTYLLPVIVEFFSDFESSILMQSVTLKDYVGFLILIIHLSLFTLILPCIALLIKSTGYRKFIYMGIIILSALITPPDIFSLILTALPTIILFEITTFLHLLNK